MDKTDSDDSSANSEWSFLHEVAGLLAAGGVLSTPTTEPIWRFEHPEKLKVKNDNFLNF